MAYPFSSSNFVDSSGTVTTGGTSQTALAANAARKALLLHNPHTTDDLFFNFTSAAATNGSGGTIRLAAGATIGLAGELCTPDPITVNSATTGRPYTVKER